VTAAVMARAKDAHLLQAFQRLFRQSLEARQNGDCDNGTDDDESSKHAKQSEEEQTFFANLRLLGWIQHPHGLLQQPLSQALHDTILNWVRSTISTDFESEGLHAQVQDYQEAIVLPWLKDLVQGPGERFEADDDWTLKIQYTCAECYCIVRNEEIFELVADYPDSHPAVMELKQVLDQHTQMHSSLGEALKQSLIRRLNHPGAGTHQIIDMYINTIKVLREIDPSDRLLQVVAEPVRSYLRRRHNTVRCIITSLTDAEVGGELYEELRRQDARPLEHSNADSDDEEEEPTFDWQPPPPISKQKGGFFDNIGLGGSSGSNGGGGGGGDDVLSILVSIFGSKELFVNEYRLMLADKLLANLDFNTDKEVHTLELLKLRFGELSMRNCEIMIKDTDDSKRIITNIHNTLKAKEKRRRQLEPEEETTTQQDPTIVDAAIVSHIFWPTLQNEQFKHHPRLQAGLDQFSAEYGRLKNPRRLVWLNQLGTIQLELDVLEDLEDGTTVVETREFSVGPLLATLISHFEDKDEWTADELSNETGIPEHTIKKRMAYWTGHRVLQLQPPSTYVIATQEHLLAGGEGENSVPMEEDGHESRAVSVAAQEEEDLAVYESYICGMLNTHGQLPLERIHNTLKMFVTGSDIKYNKTPQQLSRLLQHLCKQDRLECGPDGMYKLVRK
jgi:anaphase-promoting complex subunit 2